MNVRSAVPVWPERRFYPMDLVVLGIKDASKPVSRVLSFKTAIYLVAPLPVRSSRLPGTVGPTICPSTALLRIEFTATDASTPSGGLLPPPFHPYLVGTSSLLPGSIHFREEALFAGTEAVYLCCTFPRVAPGGCYPLSLPCGARTFLTGGPFAPPARLSSLLAKGIVPHLGPLVKRIPEEARLLIEIQNRARYNILVSLSLNSGIVNVSERGTSLWALRYWIIWPG